MADGFFVANPPATANDMSSFSWLDYSEQDRRLALDVIDKFREHETVDELGIGALRDALADLFFPGTGTVQTRARYFLFVPWMYQELERRRVSSAEIRAKARKVEIALIDVLADSENSDGAIGVLARSGLKRLPSAIYWQGLGRLGIRTFTGSQDQYHRSLDRYYCGGALVRGDDGELLGLGRTRNWCAGLPDAPDTFPHDVTLTLTPEEGRFLRDQLALCAPQSLFRHLADRDDDLGDAEYAWDLPDASDLPLHLQDQQRHARNLSEIMHGASLLYNLMLAQLKKNEELIAYYTDWLAEWADLMCGRREEHDAWSRAEFWALIASTGANVSRATCDFVNAWIDTAGALHGRSPATSAEARDLISSRERKLKGAQLVGRRRDCGIDATLAAEPNRSGLRDILAAYAPPAPSVIAELEELRSFEERSDAIRRALSTRDWTATVVSSAEPQKYTVTLSSGPTKGERRLDGVARVRCRPVLLMDSAFIEIGAGPGFSATFESLTSFYAFDVTLSDAPEDAPPCRFVVNARLDGAPEGRSEAITQYLLRDRQQVVQFLLLLLADPDEESLFGGDVAGVTGEPNAADQPSTHVSEALLEPLLRALDRNPARLDDVARILADLRKSDDGRAKMPLGIDDVWMPIWAARESSEV